MSGRAPERCPGPTCALDRTQEWITGEGLIDGLWYDLPPGHAWYRDGEYLAHVATGVLVGPLPVIKFADGSTQAYDVPRDTMDLRYVACHDHHAACDCREALLAEDIHEYRTMYRELEQVILAAISGHQTYAYTGPSDTGWQGKDLFGQCKCQACAIARAARIGGGQCARQYMESSRRLEFERREHDREYYDRHYPQTDEVPF